MGAVLARARRLFVLTGELVAFPHTIFALPFAFMGMLLGTDSLPTARQVVLVVAAMVGARTAAMSFNRIVDRSIDAENPRTSGRPLPSGRLSPAWALGILIVSSILFFAAAAGLGPLCLALSPVALAIVLGYSYTKRITWLSHAALGLGLAIAPVGAWIAVEGTMSPVPFLLALAVLCWTAGFDILYSCQDVSFDRAHSLLSIPARFGIPAALRFSSILHALMIVALFMMGMAARLGIPFHLGLTLTAAALIYEHRIVRPDDLSRINLAFFTLNGWVSVILFAATLLDRAL